MDISPQDWHNYPRIEPQADGSRRYVTRPEVIVEVRPPVSGRYLLFPLHMEHPVRFTPNPTADEAKLTYAERRMTYERFAHKKWIKTADVEPPMGVRVGSVRDEKGYYHTVVEYRLVDA